MKEFTKKDLKPGMVVEYNNGSRRLVLSDRLIGDGTYNWLESYTEELKSNANDELNVKKVYISNAYSLDDLFEDDCLVLIWEREEIESMTATQMAALIEELTGKKVRIEPSMEEMYRALDLYCSSTTCPECIFNGDCLF